ncbi:MAG TPA: YoaK family protein [Pseudonocardia sp.]|nr:YoaK family protein [Pseudonocardia sp.]
MLTVPRPLRDAWRTLVPERDGPHGPLPSVLVALTVATGVVDAFSYLVLGHVFVANMTGNVIFIAVSLAGAPEFSLPASVVSLLAFVVGAVGAARLGRRVGAHRGRQVLVLCAVETVLLATAFGCAELVANPFTGGWGYLLIVLTALAMGGQGGLVRRLGVPDLTTLVMTTTIIGTATDGRLGGGKDGRVGTRLVSVLSLALGALVGGVIARYADPALPLLLAAAILAGITLAAVRLARSTRAWAVAHGRGG